MASNDELSRSITVTSAHAEAEFKFRQMTAHDELSRLFRYDIEVLSEDPAIDFDKILGHDMTVTVQTIGQADRYFHGYVSDISYIGAAGRYAAYRATLRPWLWFLTRTSDCRIFYTEDSPKTVPKIVMEVFKTHGFDGYVKDALNRTDYRQWEYCVQYRETDFNFISRLLEQEGIYYYFTHEDGKHTMVLTDGYNGHDVVGGYEDVPFMLPSRSADSHEDCVNSWEVVQSVQPGIYSINDFDFKKPNSGLETKHVVQRQHGHADFEMYDYPGEYVETAEGDAYVRARLNEAQCEFERVRGSGNSRGITVGSLFNLTDCGRDDQNREYLVCSSVCELNDTSYETGVSTAGAGFEVSFEAIDSTHQFRPARITPKPVVQGPQTAIVVGESGEEIWTDKYGRVKVQFHWDREGVDDQNSSCWIRVAQVWAGKNWGAMYIPRIGQEVIVDFLEGDPDKPIITGRVYNAGAMPPYDLPANKTMSTIKSDSTKGGQGSNEIRFEDKKGEEQFYTHAQKNQDSVVENDETKTVGHDRTKSVGNDEKSSIGNDRTEDVGNNETITIGVDRTESVGSNEKISIGSNRTEDVGSDETITIGANRTESVGSDETITIGADRTETVGANEKISIGASRTEDVGKDESVNVGANRSASIGKDDSLDVGKNLSVTAGDQISFKTGSASITMKKNGDIVIKGKNITVQGSGEINVKASKDITMKGKKIKQN